MQREEPYPGLTCQLKPARKGKVGWAMSPASWHRCYMAVVSSCREASG